MKCTFASGAVLQPRVVHQRQTEPHVQDVEEVVVTRQHYRQHQQNLKLQSTRELRNRMLIIMTWTRDSYQGILAPLP